jgi:hypothetical protein
MKIILSESTNKSFTPFSFQLERKYFFASGHIITLGKTAIFSASTASIRPEPNTISSSMYSSPTVIAPRIKYNVGKSFEDKQHRQSSHRKSEYNQNGRNKNSPMQTDFR